MGFFLHLIKINQSNQCIIITINQCNHDPAVKMIQFIKSVLVDKTCFKTLRNHYYLAKPSVHTVKLACNHKDEREGK